MRKLVDKDDALKAVSWDTEAYTAIGMLPTIDPVKHGEWVPTDNDDTWECLVCGSLWTFIEGTPKDNGANYCPYCGASMDEVEDETH